MIILFLTLRKYGRVKKEERRDDQCEEWNITSMQWKMDLNYQVFYFKTHRRSALKLKLKQQKSVLGNMKCFIFSGFLPIPPNFTTVGKPQITVNQYDSPLDVYSDDTLEEMKEERLVLQNPDLADRISKVNLHFNYLYLHIQDIIIEQLSV